MMNETYNGVEPQKNQIAPKARTESVESLGSRSESKASLAAKGDDKTGDLGQVKFTKNVDESAVEIGGVDVAFAGMGKEELMKYANDPFWVRLRWALFILFWLVWLAMLVIAIVIVVLAPKCPAPAPLDYWQKGVFYSVNLKSFQDGAAQQDGKGDIQGLMGRLKHFVHLGVNMVSISPIFKTANDEEPLYGQDIVDYYEMNPAYGFPKDVKELTAAAKLEGVKIILDLPINHVSDQHVWFKDSVNNRTGRCGDCFIWQDGLASPPRQGAVDGTNDSPPNNWQSIFGGSAWTLATNRSQFYYHAYGPNQPDLNLRSPKVKEEIKSIMRFWLNRGVSGFRLLSVPYLFEAADLASNEPTQGEFTKNLEETYSFISELRQFLKEFEDKDGEHRVLIVEAENTEGASAMKYYGNETEPLADLVVNTQLTKKNYGVTGIQLQDSIVSYMSEVDGVKGWANWVLGNSDTKRVATRMTANLIDVVAMVQLLLPGTPFTFYGDEIGMEDVPPFGGSTTNCDSQLSSSYHCNQANSPYQWDSIPETGGFTNSTPWYAMGNNVAINAKDQMSASESHLSIYRDLVRLRKEPAMMYGTVNIISNLTSESIFTFTRIRKGAPGFVVLINLGEVTESISFENEPSIPLEATTVVTSLNATATVKGSKVSTDNVPVGPNEGVVLSFVPKF